jgi:hypothetical protein
VELSHGEVRHLVAEDFLEEAVGGGLEVGGDADEAAVGIAAAEAPRQARAPLDAASRFEIGDAPEAEPALQLFPQGRGKVGGRFHGRKANTNGAAEREGRIGSSPLPLGTGRSRVEVRVVSDLSEVLRWKPAPRVLGVDMPIGLLDRAVPGGRDCDRAARALLKDPVPFKGR